MILSLSAPTGAGGLRRLQQQIHNVASITKIINPTKQPDTMPAIAPTLKP